MTSKANYKVYMDVQIGGTAAGRIIFELFNDLTSKTSQNFRALCTGEYKKKDNMNLHYLNTRFHKIIDGFVIQGGDISNGGIGGYSIYGRTFVDESFARTHSCAGLLSMASTARNANASQFYITLKACPHLDGKNVVFGQVIDGMEIVKKIAKVPIDKNNKPVNPVMIIDCGQIDDFRGFLRYDPFKKEVFDQIRKARERIINDQHKIRKMLSEGLDPNTAYEFKKNLEICDKELANLDKREAQLKHQKQQQKQENHNKQEEEKEEENEKTQVNDKLRKVLGIKATDKYMEMRLKINQANANINKAVLLEQKKDTANYDKEIKKQLWYAKKNEAQKQAIAKGLSADKSYLNRVDHKKQQTQKAQSLAWNVFGQQGPYQAYDRRCKGLKKDDKLYQAQMNGEIVKPPEERLNQLEQDIIKQKEKRQLFSRRRIYDQDQKVNYINERNRAYNLKLERGYGQYAASTKAALQMNSQKK